MTTQTNERIGDFVARVRQERGMTQAELAQRLGTSQSAINRIEKGRQNLSIETLGRLSEALNKQLVSLGSGSVNLRIEGGHELSGAIKLKTSKNAAVGLLCASLLNHGTTKFTNFPRIEEVFRILEVLESIGVQTKWTNGNDLELKRPPKLRLDKLDKAAARKTRTVIMLMGPLMHELTEFKIPYAGGCKLGARTVEPHLFALQEFGLNAKAHAGSYHVSVRPKPAGRFALYEMGDTVTENALMAAAGRTEESVIEFASANYMVQDLCFFLQKLGVHIDGIGTTTLRVRGVKHIKKNITYAPAEDPIEAMFFIAAAVTTNSAITIERVPMAFVTLELLKLRKMGLHYTLSDRYVASNGKTELADLHIQKHDGKLKALSEKIHSLPYPGVNADNLPYFVPICAVAKGRTLIHDWMYENRAIYYTEVSKIGANIELADPHRVYITGPTTFTRADVFCPPALRPASLLLIGMLAADGISTLRNIYTIQRGYEDLAERLNSLGARIEVFQDL
ncbi:UDP-N-acetylglucosamine 1-carboxyvinyltransferase [Candidatus Saccharibacteria bacterium]|nr:MAG: UDP-N-acetylglucosamine 1-carboxyvinyltransferase [Candidatus Saccharibacteria bacterium]PID99001.1 MAG: UDP-N-acetylglucosamine 1-carboxyvinyltransferase [Candidatus Saccharibacteria bacterium]